MTGPIRRCPQSRDFNMTFGLMLTEIYPCSPEKVLSGFANKRLLADTEVCCPVHYSCACCFSKGSLPAREADSDQRILPNSLWRHPVCHRETILERRAMGKRFQVLTTKLLTRGGFEACRQLHRHSTFIAASRTGVYLQVSLEKISKIQVVFYLFFTWIWLIFQTWKKCNLSNFGSLFGFCNNQNWEIAENQTGELNNPRSETFQWTWIYITQTWSYYFKMR